MTQYRAGYLANGSWAVEMSEDGIPITGRVIAQALSIALMAFLAITWTLVALAGMQ